MISLDSIDDALWWWANAKDKEFSHQVGWATRSISQVMIDVAKVGALIPGTKPLFHMNESPEVLRVDLAIRESGLSTIQRRVILIKYNCSNRRKPNAILCIIAGLDKKKYENTLTSAKKAIGQYLQLCE